MSAPTHKPILDYFKSLNAAAVDFAENSFFRMDLSEINGAFRSGITFPCMAVESPEGEAGDSGITNSVMGRIFAFTIYMNPQLNNHEQQNEFLDTCERIGLKILSRMKHDATQPGHLLYDRFELSSCNHLKIGPVFTEMLYGYRFTGIIKGSESFKVVAADWNDLDTVC